MGTSAVAERTVAAASRAEFRAALERVLADVDSDERLGPLLRASGLRLRLRFPDLDMTLNVAPSEAGGHHLRWSFADEPGWSPKLEMDMDSGVANRYLQGEESLAIAIARGRVRVRGESRIALLYVPALRPVCDRYRRIVASEFPRLEVTNDVAQPAV